MMATVAVSAVKAAEKKKKRKRKPVLHRQLRRQRF
jgi:hypothetical protein